MEDGNELKLKLEQMAGKNKVLREAIVELWKENITTFEIGQSGDNINKLPYVKFNITNENLQFLYKLYDNCFKYKDFYNFVNGGINVTIYNVGRQAFMDICVLPIYRDVLYGLIVESIHNLRLQRAEIEECIFNKTDTRHIKTSNDIVACCLNLMYYFSNQGLMVKFSATGNKMYIGIGDSTQRFIFNDRCPILSNEISSFKANNEVSLASYKCDRDSLVNLINFVYRLSKDKQKSKSI